MPVKLIYLEEFQRIDAAFYREKQVQGWSRKKKEALIKGNADKLKELAKCMNSSHYKHVTSAASSTMLRGQPNNTDEKLKGD